MTFCAWECPAPVEQAFFGHNLMPCALWPAQISFYMTMREVWLCCLLTIALWDWSLKKIVPGRVLFEKSYCQPLPWANIFSLVRVFRCGCKVRHSHSSYFPWPVLILEQLQCWSSMCCLEDRRQHSAADTAERFGLCLPEYARAARSSGDAELSDVNIAAELSSWHQLVIIAVCTSLLIQRQTARC